MYAEKYVKLTKRILLERKNIWERGLVKFFEPYCLTEYGISRVNSVDKRVQWLETVHDIFDKYGISASYFQYKNAVGAFINVKTGFNQLG